MKLIKSYKHKLDLNTEKKRYIENVLYVEWKRVASLLMLAHMRYFYENSKICKTNELYKQIETTLTERYKDCINRQVVGMFSSKISNMKNTFENFINKSNLSDKLKSIFGTINYYNMFFLKEDNRSVKNKIPADYLLIARKLFKRYFGKLPSTDNINMVLQSKIVDIEEAENHNCGFQYMLRLSKGNKNKRGEFLHIPVMKNTYSNRFDKKLSTSCTFAFDKGKLVNVILYKDFDEITENPNLNDMTISFDIGLNILIAMNNGDCYGKHYMKQIKKFDKELLEIQEKLKAKYGKFVKLNNYPEYYKLVKRIKDYSKNEINRLLNKIYRRYRPMNIIVEDLNFKGSSLSKTLNRLLHKFGLGFIKAKLLQLSIEYKVNIITTDAAYSSQMCSKCGYIDSKNRKTQSDFTCKCCGHRLNADVNGSRVVKYFGERFAERKFYGNKGMESKRTLLVTEFVRNTKVWLDSSRHIQAMMENPYFKDFLPLLREKYTLLSLNG